jgi:uncharacterized protein
MHSVIVGRQKEREVLKDLLQSRDAEFCAVYGRRRIGKTFLVRECFAGHDMYFELAGEKDAGLSEQLHNFVFAFRQRFPETSVKQIRSWRSALQLLAQTLEACAGDRRIVLFLDELPWLSSPKSGFLSALDHFWNSWASRRNVLLIVCGSASSWMIGKIIHNKGGLHNRITAQIRLMPFSLLETEEYLKSRGVNLGRKDLLELYLCVGGVPFYLRHVQKGLSVAQNLDHMCLASDAVLRDEFKYLFSSLFDNPQRHVQVIRALAEKRRGMTRNELLAAAGEHSGGGLSRTLGELEESGFVAREKSFGKSARDSIYRLIDEYSLFYLAWVDKAGPQTEGYWQAARNSRGWGAWSGFSFEGVCLKHVGQLKKQLGISGVATAQSAWACRDKEKGAQIDLVIDRADNCINLCEMKFSIGEFVIDKSCAEQLRRKAELFQRRTGVRKSLFITMVTTYGCKHNEHYTQTVARELTMDDLFVPMG